jgi:hypothetical protein
VSGVFYAAVGEAHADIELLVESAPALIPPSLLDSLGVLALFS